MTPPIFLLFAAFIVWASGLGACVGLLGFIVWLFQGAKPVHQRIEEDELRRRQLEAA
jgi:hypothetical protein